MSLISVPFSIREDAIQIRYGSAKAGGGGSTISLANRVFTLAFFSGGFELSLSVVLGFLDVRKTFAGVVFRLYTGAGAGAGAVCGLLIVLAAEALACAFAVGTFGMAAG